MFKNLFRKIEIKYGLYGVLLGFLIIIFDKFFSSTEFGLNIVLTLVSIPTRIISLINPCQLKGFGCLYYGVDLAVFNSTIYLGILGFLIGTLVKLRNIK